MQTTEWSLRLLFQFEVCRTRSLRGGKQVFLPESSSDLTICDLKHEFKILSMLKAVKGVSRPLEFIDAVSRCKARPPSFNHIKPTRML